MKTDKEYIIGFKEQFMCNKCKPKIAKAVIMIIETHTYSF